MENNAVEFNAYFAGKYTLESICGMLGNVQRESTFKPWAKRKRKGLVMGSYSVDAILKPH